ncbi:aromatic hydrocarbon degradation protein [Thiosulfatimonas sediminis]|uniref:Aromatic hydrocarbon degradation protein n=1 Tax=Thiosulfatimonas sediminis TaxID=2675054 RepID=A0A6F8PXD6_9GAMM|nr:outer membrane protein transport protein [Thiosulfatimonas sediminis]BBP46664.1 aromatic hydrocarbon degradation protein [Thiosulfatimonas sediminis]
MRKTKLALALSTAAFATTAMATNGTNMIGIGAKSNAMGGTGVAAYFGAENMLANPAMIGKSKGTELIFGGTIFSPDVSTNHFTDIDQVNETRSSSDANLFVIPSAAFSSRINENMVYGIGMFGTSGLGADYKSVDGLFNGQTALQVLRFAPTLAFHNEKGGIGFSPLIQYGALDINYQYPFAASSADPSRDEAIGYGLAQGLGFGYAIGTYYDLAENFTVAASYTSSVDMEYKGQITTAAQPFGVFGFNIDHDHLEQPAEMKIGAAYSSGKMTYTADAKRIMFGEAKGYQDFGWQNSDVLALGAKYQAKDYWVAAGYNHSDSPVAEQDGTTGPGAVANFFNNTLFPATTESHYTLGGGMAISKRAIIEGALVYAPEVTSRFDTSALAAGASQNGTIIPSESVTKHSQMGATMMIRYNFEE